MVTDTKNNKERTVATVESTQRQLAALINSPYFKEFCRKKASLDISLDKVKQQLEQAQATIASEKDNAFRNLGVGNEARLLTIFSLVLLMDMPGWGQAKHYDPRYVHTGAVAASNIFIISSILGSLYFGSRLFLKDIPALIAECEENGIMSGLAKHGLGTLSDAGWTFSLITSAIADFGKKAAVLSPVALSYVTLAVLAIELVDGVFALQRTKKESDKAIRDTREQILSLLPSDDIVKRLWVTNHLTSNSKFHTILPGLIREEYKALFAQNTKITDETALSELNTLELLILLESKQQDLAVASFNQGVNNLKKGTAFFVCNLGLATAFTPTQALVAAGLTLMLSGALPPVAIVALSVVATMALTAGLIAAVGLFFGENKKSAEEQNQIKADITSIKNAIEAKENTPSQKASANTAEKSTKSSPLSGVGLFKQIKIAAHREPPANGPTGSATPAQ